MGYSCRHLGNTGTNEKHAKPSPANTQSWRLLVQPRVQKRLLSPGRCYTSGTLQKDDAMRVCRLIVKKCVVCVKLLLTGESGLPIIKAKVLEAQAITSNC